MSDKAYEPAFPLHIKLRNKEGEEPFREDVGYGLTKREYFAVTIYAGMWANSESIKAMLNAAGVGAKCLADAAVKSADVLLAELEKGGEWCQTKYTEE